LPARRGWWSDRHRWLGSMPSQGLHGLPEDARTVLANYSGKRFCSATV